MINTNIKIEFNKKQFEADFQKTFEGVMGEASEFMQSYIIEEKRTFPRTTIRHFGRGTTGKIANSPRDVVDSGKLRDSFSFLIKNGFFEVSWQTEYINLIYFGYKNVPSYPWVHLALRAIDWDEVIEKYWSH